MSSLRVAEIPIGPVGDEDTDEERIVIELNSWNGVTIFTESRLTPFGLKYFLQRYPGTEPYSTQWSASPDEGFSCRLSELPTVIEALQKAYRTSVLK